MPNDAQPTINDFLSRLYVIRDTAADAVREQARALVAADSAKGMRTSGKTLKGLAGLVEAAFETALAETLAVLRHMQSVPEIDPAACRDQAFLRSRELVATLRAASGIDQMLEGTGSDAARETIDQRIARLLDGIGYRFRQFDVGLDQVGVATGEAMTPTAMRLQQRLSERRSWFHNQWFFKWHHIGGNKPVEIDLFNGQCTSLAGIKFWGSPREVYWDAISRGLRKEVLDQFEWVEEAAKRYGRGVAIQAITECAGLLTGFTAAMRHAAVEKDRILRGDGLTFPPLEDRGRWEGTTEQDIRDQAEALTAALFPPAATRSTFASAAPSVAPPPALPSLSVKSSDPPAPAYQVALSFAGEQRDYVRQVAAAMAARHITVFYDEYEAIPLWGTDGAEHFHRIYSGETQYVVMFISAEYVAKAWTRQERRAAISRQMKSDSEYILPVRFDDTEVAGIPDTMQYLLAKNFTPAELAVAIATKIGISPRAGKASHVPPPSSGARSGEVTFDHGAHDGRFVIGAGATAFETSWTKAGPSAVHLYNDPPGIHGVAIARGAAAIDQIEDAASYDFTSRYRTLRVGEIGVLCNTNGFYAAVQILQVDDDRHGAPSDALTIRYTILPMDETSFAARSGDGPST